MLPRAMVERQIREAELSQAEAAVRVVLQVVREATGKSWGNRRQCFHSIRTSIEQDFVLPHCFRGADFSSAGDY